MCSTMEKSRRKECMIDPVLFNEVSGKYLWVKEFVGTCLLCVLRELEERAV